MNEKKVKKIASSKAGAGTIYRITLPVEWLRMMDLEGGDDVILEYHSVKKEITIKKIIL